MTSVLVYMLAVWRLAHMLVKEDGPAEILAWLRDDADPTPVHPVVRQALHCVSCTSVWVAGLLLLFPWQVRLLLAGSAVAKIIEDYFYESAGEVLDISGADPIHYDSYNLGQRDRSSGRV